jgi:hypothetical protein
MGIFSRKSKTESESVEAIVVRVLHEIEEARRQSFLGLTVSVPANDVFKTGEVARHIEDLGYFIGERDDTLGRIKVKIPMRMLPDDPEAKFGRCQQHRTPLIPRKDPRLALGPPYCPDCGHPGYRY